MPRKLKWTWVLFWKVAGTKKLLVPTTTKWNRNMFSSQPSPPSPPSQDFKILNILKKLRVFGAFGGQVWEVRNELISSMWNGGRGGPPGRGHFENRGFHGHPSFHYGSSNHQNFTHQEQQVHTWQVLLVIVTCTNFFPPTLYLEFFPSPR